MDALFAVLRRYAAGERIDPIEVWKTIRKELNK